MFPAGQALPSLLEQTQSQHKPHSQTHGAHWDPFLANGKEIEQTCAERVISDKDKIRPKGKFEIGNSCEPKVSDNRTADIWVSIDNTNANLIKLRINTILYAARWPAHS